MIRSKLLLLPLIFMGVVGIVSLLPTDTAAALSGTGYFTGKDASWSSGFGGDVLSGRPSNNAIPSDVDTKAEFISFIKGKLNSGSSQDKTGAAFIINLMVGASRGGGWARDRSPSAAMVNDWEARINQRSVSMSRINDDPNNYGSVSFYDSSIDDDFFTSYNSGDRELIVFKQDGNIVAVVEVPCANPVGRGTYLRKASFNNVGSSRVSRSTARPGQSVKWTHTVTNIGSGNMDKKLFAVAKWTSGKSGDRKRCDIAGGLNAGASTTSCSNWSQIPSTAKDGTKYCQRVDFQPKSSTNGQASHSATACVTVSASWRVTGATALNAPASGEGREGDAYKFTHTITNHGPNNINQSGRCMTRVRVQYSRNSTDGSNGTWSTKTTGVATLTSGQNYRQYNSLGPDRSASLTSTGELPKLDRYPYCERIKIVYSHSKSTTIAFSRGKCVTMKRDFDLIPKTTVPSDAVEAGSSVPVSPGVENKGPTSSEPDTAWQLIGFRVNLGDTIPNQTTYSQGSADPCVHYTGAVCNNDTSRLLSNGSGMFTPGDPGSYIKTAGDAFRETGFYIPDDAPLGTKFCFALSVKPYNEETNQWRYGQTVCVVVGVTPKFEVWGYDAKTGGSIKTSLSSKSGKTFGSWGEYGVFSNGMNTGFASAAGLSGGNSRAGQANWSDLTGANTTTTCGATFGCFNGVTYPTTLVASLLDHCAVTSGGRTISSFSDGDFNSSGIVCVDGTATISGTIALPSATTDDASLSQRIIIAKDIQINANVGRVDAWLIAVPDLADANNLRGSTGRVTTCTSAGFAMATAELSSDKCATKLTITGPVIAQQLYLMRTHFDQDSPGTPAEIFNLRADAFLWSYQGLGSGQPTAQTTNVTELPPRF